MQMREYDSAFDWQDMLMLRRHLRKTPLAYLWQTKQGERNVRDYYSEMTFLWQELDLNSEEDWECSKDSVKYKKKDGK